MADSSISGLQLLVLACICSAFLISGSRSRVLLIVVAVLPFIAFLRRITSDQSQLLSTGQGFDPLVLTPLIGCAVVLAGAILKSPDLGSLSSARLDPLVRLCIFGAIGSAAISIGAQGALDPTSLYYGALLVVPLLLMASIVIGRVPDVWTSVERILPWLAIVAGIYGLYQFFVLPTWDRDWMLGSQLQSIGQPYPLRVRVFGTLESPGPFAEFVGAGALIAFHHAITARGAQRWRWGSIALGLMGPVLLSGVRAALVSILICVVVAGFTTARGMGRALPVLVAGTAFVGVGAMTSRFGGGSTVFSQQRYSLASAGTDPSVQARLKLISVFRESLGRVIGNPVGVRADNLWADLLLAYGLLAALSMIVLAAVLVRAALRMMRTTGVSSAPLITLYVLLMGMAGDLFLYSFAVVAALAFANTLRTDSILRRTKQDLPGILRA